LPGRVILSPLKISTAGRNDNVVHPRIVAGKAFVKLMTLGFRCQLYVCGKIFRMPWFWTNIFILQEAHSSRTCPDGVFFSQCGPWARPGFPPPAAEKWWQTPATCPAHGLTAEDSLARSPRSSQSVSAKPRWPRRARQWSPVYSRLPGEWFWNAWPAASAFQWVSRDLEAWSEPAGIIDNSQYIVNI